MFLFHEEGRKDAREVLGPSTTLFSDNWGKGDKCQAHGYLAGIVYMMPSPEACPWASVECFKGCLRFAGRLPMAKAARKRRDELFTTNRYAFWCELRHELLLLTKRAFKRGLKACCRINGLSDWPLWKYDEFWALVAEFPTVQFYDYTKDKEHPGLQVRTRRYHMTYSFKGEPPVKGVYHEVLFCRELLAEGGNVAVVFEAGFDLPETWQGFPVVDGDQHDLTFLHPPGTVIGLKAKGKARKLPVGGFVQSSTRELTVLEEMYNAPSGSWTGD